MPPRVGVLTPREPAVDLVRIISEGTYTSFPQALKEFISNAYDADATRVDIRVDDDSSTIIIKDNGVGMTLADFRDSFASIARPGKSGSRSLRGKTVLGRKKIGRFGIGSLAIVGAADSFTIRSSRRSSGEGFEARIDLKELRKHFFKGEDLSKHWQFPYEHWSGEAGKNHFTEVRIEGINPDIQANLERPGEKSIGEFYESTRQLSGLEELGWQLGLICPVAYSETYPIAEKHLNRGRDRIIIQKGRQLLRANFKLFLNGHEIRRQIHLPAYNPNKLKDPDDAALLEKRGLGFEVRCFRSPASAPITFEGYLVAQAAQVFPEEVRGLLVRIRDTAIGWHSTLNIATAGLATMVPSMSGEVWVDGLENALQFDRESFREDHPSYRYLRERLTQIIGEEARNFRERSSRRTSQQKRKKAAKPKTDSTTSTAKTRPGTTQPNTTPPPTSPTYSGDAYLPQPVFAGQRPYLTRLVPQINGCWTNGYYEACAVMARRLLETTIIELYSRRGWVNELKDPDTRDFRGLKFLVNKICADNRFGFDRKFQDGLKALKELGDIAAHDFRVEIKQSYLADAKSNFRFTCERLVFEITNSP